MSNTLSIQQLLLDKTFSIPPYQRDYAWTTDEVADLWSDVQEATETSQSHYLGTLVLAEVPAEKGGGYEVVDGQQRLATLTLVIHSLLEQLDPQDRDRIICEDTLLFKEKNPRLDFGRNAAFVKGLFAGTPLEPQSGGQRRLQKAYGYVCDRAKCLLSEGGPQRIRQWLNAIKSLEVIQFTAENTGRAIRLFQTVNDRGRPLANMEKAKALLVYYSSKFLAGRLDDSVNLAFGDCFSAFDTIRELASKRGYEVENISRKTFSEDDLLRYHYMAYDHPAAGDYTVTAEGVLDGFLKATLKGISQEPGKLQAFIEDYVSDLRAFALAFRDLISSTRTDKSIYELFVVLGLNALLYPLAIRLQERGLLRIKVPGRPEDLFRCLEICDVRVYKLHGSTPERDIGDLSHISRTATVQVLADRLRTFATDFSWDFQLRLSHKMYQNGALNLLLLRRDEALLGRGYDLTSLVDMVRQGITQEHIIPQAPGASSTSLGFTDEMDFSNHLHTFGNMTLLSRSDNSRFGNKPTQTKLSAPDMYAASAFIETRQLAAKYGSREGVYGKQDILRRTSDLSAIVVRDWAIW